MFSLAGYKIDEVLHKGSRANVFRGVRLKDGRGVIIKVLASEYPAPAEIESYRQEYEISRKLDLPGIVKSLSLEKYNNSVALILEDFGGQPLGTLLPPRGEKSQIELGKFLDIAISVGEALRQVHENNIIHKDIKPDNIIRNEETGEIKITDFGIASLLSREEQSLGSPDSLEGTLAYISPEQTGRMNREVDYRSDFYSLGALFYQLLTGVLPFRSTDPMELVHAHIARIPDSPGNLRDDVPEVLSEIIMKLLAKMAEDRYLSVPGILADLRECKERLQTKGVIAHFVPGQNDFSNRLNIPRKLYGREQESKTLLNAFARTGAGDKELMLVAGFSGIGKSALVNEIHKPILAYRGYFLVGKFEQFRRNIPYSAIIQAFQSLIRELLSENDEKIEVWKTGLSDALGVNAQIIIDVIPEMELIIGKQQPVPELGPTESQNRFYDTFRNFIKTFATQDHPLVLFLDDLQWADSASLNIIQLLINDAEVGFLFLIGAYRDNEVDEYHPLSTTLDVITQSGATVNRIEPGPLGQEDILNLLGDTLGRPPEELHTLTELILKKTAGNPFFVNQFLHSLYEEGPLKFDSGNMRWVWDLSKVKDMNITDNVVELLATKLQKLPPETRDVLKYAACIGNSFNLQTLLTVHGRPIETTARAIWSAGQEGFIKIRGEDGRALRMMMESDSNVPGGANGIQLKFLHDRVQQAAYSLMDENKRRELHLEIGRHMINAASAAQREEQAIDIVNHLNIAGELIDIPEERLELIQLNFSAGKKAKNSAAFEPALRYFNHALNVLPPDCWTSHYELTLELHNEAAEAEYLTGNYKRMLVLIELITTRTKKVIDKVKASQTLISYYISTNQISSTVDLALELCGELGVKLPSRAGQIRIIFGLLGTIIKRRGRKFETFINLPLMKNPEIEAAMRILMAATASILISRPELLPIITFKCFNLSLKYGVAPSSPIFLITYGLILTGVLDQAHAGYNASNSGITLLDKKGLNADINKPRAAYMYYYCIPHFSRYPDYCVQELNRGLQRAQELGDYESFAYGGGVRLNLMFILGVDLNSLKKEYQKFITLLKNIQHESALLYNPPSFQMILNLSEEVNNPNELEGEYFSYSKTTHLAYESKNLPPCFVMEMNSLILKYYFRDFNEALKYARKMFQLEEGVISFPIVPLGRFFYCLTLLALCRDAGRSDKKKYLKTVKLLQKRFKTWAKNAPMNYKHRYDLIEAEKARIQGRIEVALELYESAIKLARENEYLQDQALGNELLGDFYLSLGKTDLALFYLLRACNLYLIWGARSKVKHIQASYPGLNLTTHGTSSKTTGETLTTTNATTTAGLSSSTAGNSGALDLGSVLKASRIISGEIKLENLLGRMMQILMENAGARRGLLILERRGTFYIEAEDEVDGEHSGITQPVAVDSADKLPLSLIQYVARTNEQLVLEDARESEQFKNDAYIKRVRPRSLLCSPILNLGKLIGMIYLENNLTAGAFTPARLEVVEMLSSQAAVSLENASLYAGLEEKVKERTAELLASKKEIDDIMENVSQGLMTIYPDGRISSGYSRRVSDILERGDLGDTKFENLFLGDVDQKKKVADYLDLLLHNKFMSETIFSASNPLKEYAYKLTDKNKQSVTKILNFNFSRIYESESREIQKLMVVLHDKTDEIALKKELEAKAREEAGKVEKLYQILQLPPGVFGGFIKESRATLEGVHKNLLALGENRSKNMNSLKECFREVHTLKGNARALNLDSIGKVAHELEDVFDKIKNKPEDVSVELKADVIAALEALKIEINDGNSIFEKILGMQSALKGNSQEVDAMSAFETRIRNVSEKESAVLGKPINFTFQNNLPEALSETTLANLLNPLSHIVRNSITHGIESAETRRTRQKDPAGRVSLTLKEAKGYVYIVCEDDGGGLDTKKIRHKAADMGFLSPAEADALSEVETYKLIFSSGLSTAPEVSDSAGRGVGMDAVKADLKKMGATILIKSIPGKFTRFTIRLRRGD